jgi:hypothetical protein
MQNTAAMRTVSWISRSVRAQLTRLLDVRGGDELATLGRLAGDDEQRFELVGDGGVCGIGLDRHHQVLGSAEMVCRDGAVNRLAVAAVVLRRTKWR